MIMEGREQSRGKQQGQRRLGRRTWGPGVGSGVGESPESAVPGPSVFPSGEPGVSGIQPSPPLSSPSPLAPNPSQHQSLFQRVDSSHEVAKGLEFPL